MKRIITIISILFLSCSLSFAQNRNSYEQKSSKITIDIGKISNGLGKAVKFVKSEVKQFKQEWDDAVTPEEKQLYDDTKKNVKEGLKYTREAIHQGWRQGLRGEPYTPPTKEDNK